jgi:hypothetical protein
MSDQKEYVELLERIVKLEVTAKIKFEERDKALELARDLADKHFVALNQSKEHLVAVENTFASKEYVGMMITPLRKLLYVGAGILIAANALLWLVKN